MSSPKSSSLSLSDDPSSELYSYSGEAGSGLGSAVVGLEGRGMVGGGLVAIVAGCGLTAGPGPNAPPSSGWLRYENEVSSSSNYHSFSEEELKPAKR